MLPCRRCGCPFDHDLLGRDGCPNCEGSLPPVVDTGLTDLGDGGDPRLDIRQRDERDVAAVGHLRAECAVGDRSANDGLVPVRHAGRLHDCDAVVNVHENILSARLIVSRGDIPGLDSGDLTNGRLDSNVPIGYNALATATSPEPEPARSGVMKGQDMRFSKYLAEPRITVDEATPPRTIEHDGRTITYRWRSNPSDNWEGWQRRTPEGWVAIRDDALIAKLEK